VLLSRVITGKFGDHLPLYRLKGILGRQEVDLSRSTMCDWLAECAGLLEPVVKAMIRRVLSSKVIGTDDTPVMVPDHGGKWAKTGGLWAYRLRSRITAFEDSIHPADLEPYAGE
jgi:hypothetical protein